MHLLSAEFSTTRRQHCCQGATNDLDDRDVRPRRPREGCTASTFLFLGVTWFVPSASDAARSTHTRDLSEWGGLFPETSRATAFDNQSVVQLSTCRFKACTLYKAAAGWLNKLITLYNEVASE